MKYSELIQKLSQEKIRRKPRHIESRIQQACVSWIRLAHPELICFAVPNGGSRNRHEAENLKKEGVMAGVSDLVIVAQGAILFIEMKSEKGRQQDTQKQFQISVERLGHTYSVCRSLNEFKMTIERWLKVVYGVK